MAKKQLAPCMIKYKEKFRKNFEKLAENNSQKWIDLQWEYRKYLWTFDWIFYIGGFLLGFIPGKNETEYILSNHIIIGIFCAILALISTISTNNINYQMKLKKIIFQDLLKIFSKDIVYGRNGIIGAGTFDKSKLFKKKTCWVSCSDTQDAFGGEYNDVPFRACEVRAIWNNGKKGKEYTESDLFNGLGLYFRLKKEINTVVHIYSKSIFNRPQKGFEKVELEYEKFNKKFDVYVEAKNNSTNQIEARYLLNVAFLERLVDIKMAFKVKKFKCSVFEDEMLILLYKTKDLFEMNHLFKDVKDPAQYEKLFNEFASVLSFIDVLKLSSSTKL